MTSERVFPFDSYVLFFPAPRGMCSAGPRRAFCTLTVSLSFPSVNIIHFLPPSHPPLPPPPHLPPVSERGRYNTAYLVSKKVGEIFFFLSLFLHGVCRAGGHYITLPDLDLSPGVKRRLGCVFRSEDPAARAFRISSRGMAGAKNG